ncbi:MAG: DUF5957 family protein [Phycicoccus sp.]
MRKVALAVGGILAGVLVGLLVNDVLVRLLLDDGTIPESLPLALFLGFLPVFLAGTGAVVALLLDARRGRRGPGDPR